MVKIVLDSYVMKRVFNFEMQKCGVHIFSCGVTCMYNIIMILRSIICVYYYYRPANGSGDNDKVSGDVGDVETEQQQQVVGEQAAEKVAPLFSQPATTITIDTEACTHEVRIVS